jgi:hypothetical protein
MHELPGFALANAAWTEVRAAAIDYAESPRSGKVHGQASARLRRASIAYADAWRAALDSLRGEWVPPGRVVIPDFQVAAFQAFLGAARRLRAARRARTVAWSANRAMGDLVRAAGMVQLDAPADNKENGNEQPEGR